MSAVVPGGPCEHPVNGERVEPHDKILEIDGKPVTNANASEVNINRKQKNVFIKLFFYTSAVQGDAAHQF